VASVGFCAGTGTAGSPFDVSKADEKDVSSLFALECADRVHFPDSASEFGGQGEFFEEASRCGSVADWAG